MAKEYEKFAEHGELVVGVLGGFLLAALVLVLQNPTTFETYGEPYVDGLLAFMAVGVLGSVFASLGWASVASARRSEGARPTHFDRFALWMTSLTVAMLLIVIPMLIIPYNWALGFLIGGIGVFLNWAQTHLGKSPK